MRKLKEEEVKERLKSYNDPAVTDELYDFGKMLMSEMMERNNRLETKAVSIAAYSIGIITLLASTFNVWNGKVSAIGMFIGAMFAFIATLSVVLAVALRWYEGVSQADWFKKDVLTNREALRKFHLVTMWAVFDSHEANAQKKARRIGWAQWSLLVAAISIFFSLVHSLF